MANRGGGSGLEDPLVAYSGLSLFPRTLSSLPNPPKPYDPDDPHHIHNFLKSMPLESSVELLEQAKAIVDGSSELLNSVKPSDAVPKDTHEVASSKGMENPQERRPALGRKRARFSLKPNLSQPTVIREPSMEMDKLKDPEEFFLAFEKLENAKRELQKQTGGLIESDQYNLSKSARPRRPGILRRSVKYKHNYSSVASQETLQETIHSPSDYSSREEAAVPTVALPEAELAGSVTASEDRVNDLLDQLLTGSYEELDGDAAVSVLQERLQIKPIDLEKLCLPDMHDVLRIDLKTSGRNLLKPRKTLPDIQNLLKGVSSKTPLKRKQPESSSHALDSPTPPKSPFAGMSLLKKRILESNPLNDLFSSFNIDQPPARNSSSPTKSINKRSDHSDYGKELSVSGKLKSLIIEEDDRAVANSSSPKVAMVDFANPSDKSLNKSTSILEPGTDLGPSGSQDDMQGNIGGSSMDDRVANENKSQACPDRLQANAPNELSDKVKDILQEAGNSQQPGLDIEDSSAVKSDCLQNHLDASSPAVEDPAIDGPTALSGQLQHNKEVQESSVVPLNKQSKSTSSPQKGRKSEKIMQRQARAGMSSPVVVEDLAIDGLTKSALEQQNKEVQEFSRVPQNEESKPASRPQRENKRKQMSRRQSLAGSGTSWESGVRRSTRIRSRPLEYWRGERFLYGRIHQSLATVIGIKYESPAKADGKPTIKVKSFVSDEYKDLVELAARF